MPTVARLRVMLRDPDPIVRAHARHRLAAVEADPAATPATIEMIPTVATPVDDLAEDLALLTRARACRFKVTPDCGCRYGSCSRLGRDVSPRDCLACLRAGEDMGSTTA